MGDARLSPNISVVIACYKDAEAIGEMYSRIRNSLESAGLTFEVIFVNDGSPDDSAQLISALSAEDPRVRGINHSRNFGSQFAFTSGMSRATGEAVVIMDGDLQDPPELIPQLWERFQSGYDIVYGLRSEREMGRVQLAMVKLFYSIYSQLGDFHIPRNAGDFSLLSRRAVAKLMEFGERDLFLRGLRAYVGFRQTGVEYFRPERPYGKSTNNLWRNIEWAKLAVFSSSTRPLTLVLVAGSFIFLASVALLLWLVVQRLVFPETAVPGITLLAVLVTFFGGLNLLAVGLIGEYVGRVLRETKARPGPIVDSVVENGQVIRVEGQNS